jgi:amino acid adenylation domain-containing protein
VRLVGELRPGALAAALSEVLRRHQVLRTSFPVDRGEPAQSIAPPGPFPLPHADLSGLPGPVRGRLEREIRSAEGLRPFDLARGPLVRALLLRLDPAGGEHLLVLTLHHIVSDGWSTGILIHEMAALYRAFAAGEPSPLPDLPIQYADFAAWQREWLSGPVLESQLAYWRRQLADPPPALELPTDRPRPPRPTLAGAHRLRLLPPALAQDLRALGRNHLATLFMSLLSAWTALLARLTRASDLTLGSPIANRNRQEIEGLIGFFVNTLVLRLRVEGGLPFNELLGHAREVTLEAAAHQDLPFERLVEELAPERDLRQTPLFRVMFVVQNAPAREIELPGISWTAVPVETGAANFDLTLTFDDTPQGLRTRLEYKRELFDAASIERLLDQLEVLAAAAAADPGRPVSELPMLREGERHQLLVELAAGAEEHPADERLESLFDRQAGRSPDAVAVCCGAERRTYGELRRSADRLAARLRALGVQPEVRVGIRLDRSIGLVVAILGVLKAGGTYVPIDPAYPEERARLLLTDAGISILVTERGLAAGLAADGVATVLIEDLERAGEPAADAAAPRVPAGLVETAAYVIYTSGSTGRPKGVPVSHANVVRLFAATRPWFGFGPGDVWTLFHSFAFDFSVWELWGALLHGGRLVVVPYWVSRSPADFDALLRDEEVTVLNQTPSAFYQLARAGEELGRGAYAALRWVVFGGEALDLQRLRSWFARHGDRRPELVNMYGITETTVHVTYRPIRAGDVERGAGSVIGVPIPDLRLYCLGPGLQPVPLGAPGELHVGGAGVARGYLGRPDLTAQRFVPDPWSPYPGARLYRSGDLARRRPEGELEYLGRADEQVKIRGFRIEPGEVEAALSQHPGVRDAVVVAHAAQGEESLRLIAYLAAAPGAFTADELRAFLRGRLPEHMVPAVFVLLDALPLTVHGKVDRRALPEPEPDRIEPDAPFAAPRTDRERVLAEAWAEVLGRDRVGIHDNFFSLGGDSIRSVRARSLAEERGFSFSLPDLFEFQTIAELAEALTPATPADMRAGTGTPPFSLIGEEDRRALPEDVEDAYPLATLQMGMLFQSDYSPGSLPYHVVSTLRLAGGLDPDLLRSALARLAARHAVLRTRFDLNGFRQPLQLVQRAVEIPLTVEDLREASPEEREAALAARIEAEKGRRFDWTRAPLLRFHVQLLGDGEARIVWSEHHAILDGWSVAAMLAELFRLYRAELGGEEPPSPPVTGFRDFVALERETLASDESRRFWATELRGLELSRIPRWPAGAGGSSRGMVLPVPVSPEVSDRLHGLAAAARVPLKSVLLAAHTRALALLTGSLEVTSGLVSNGRPETPDADRVLGLFLNTLPLRRRLGGGTWTDLVQDMARAEREMLPHRRYPMPVLLREMGGGPLFETMFNYVHFHVLDEVAQAGGWKASDLRSFSETELAFTADFSQDSTGAVHLRLHTKPGDLDDEQARAAGRLYTAALTAMALAPDGRYEDQSLLSPAEREEVLVAWNDTARDLSAGICVHERIARQAARTPDLPAVWFEGNLLSFRNLETRAGRLARALLAGRLPPETCVGICLEPSPEMVVAVLAVLKAGCAFVPLDPALPERRLELLLRDSRWC